MSFLSEWEREVSSQKGRDFFLRKEGVMEDMLLTVSNYGFPIVVSIYLLIRLENKLDKLTESILSLSSKLDRKEE